jgi:hypothetical protein
MLVPVRGTNQNVCKMRRYSLNDKDLPFPRFGVLAFGFGICSSIDFSLNSSFNNHRQRKIDSSSSQLIVQSIVCATATIRRRFDLVLAWCCWHPSPIYGI